MPRPKRAKVASKVGRVATTSKTAQAAPRKQQPTKAQPIAVSEPLQSLSDDSDGLVVKATRPRKREPWHPAPQEGADFTMTGALPQDDDDGISRTSTQKQTPASRTSRTAASKSSAKTPSSVRKSPVAAVPRSLRSTRSNRLSGAAQEEDSSGFGDNLLSFTSLDSDSPAHGTRPPSAMKVGATPAHETSILALTNFKRRPRQPSLLRMVHQTTDIEDNDLDDLGDLEDFHPDAESTPLHAQKSAPVSGGNDSAVNLSSSGSRGTKRKLSPVVQVPRSSPPYESDPDMAVSRSPSPSLPDVIHSTEEAHEDQNGGDDDPEILSQTLAPPMSSSDYNIDPIEDPAESPARLRRRNRRGRSAQADDRDDSEGEETEPAKKAKGRPKAKKNQGISTAKLQSLLPRRRRNVPREDDEDEMAFDSDQDELALPPRRQTAARRKPPTPKPAKKASRTAKKTLVVPRNTRTYGRRGSSDKENDEAHEEEEGDFEEGSTIEVATKKPSKALEAIAKQFEDIDAFEMDFESVSYVQTSSSPTR
jgi:hypothetical protein